MSNARSLAGALCLATALVASDALARSSGTIDRAKGASVYDLSGLAGTLDINKTPKAMVNIEKVATGETWSSTQWVKSAASLRGTHVDKGRWTPAFTLPSGPRLPLGDYKITLTTIDPAGRPAGDLVSVTVTVKPKKTP